MALNFADRVLTIVATATLTSAAWIVGGGSFMRYAEDQKAAETVEATAEAAKAEAVDPAPKDIIRAEPKLDTAAVSQPMADQTDQLVVPVLNVKREDLGDTFTDERSEGEALHEALDIPADKGTTVIAAAPGEVEKIFTSEAGGKTLYVRSIDRETIHFYAHLDEYAEGLKEGQRVRRGQRLGTVGSSGNADNKAPHLHFAILRTSADAEWWEPATAINPYPLLSGNNQRP
ncbi:M23 family metallopeptidase [Altererythrobacter sp. ZODW24]|uniref:M23 family metallopeptidase n=1 Tax=Altererythrobacter sp. ZODW24 TaxID=2185142 RepID=UPI000DF81F6A|nr:M23 family metallopeptidase [Altererythrobacter sp. ZODW24]